MVKSYSNILLDLDGTIIDSEEGITRSVEYALSYWGIKVKDRKSLRCFIGPPLKDSFMHFCHFTEQQAQKAIEKYRERYGEKGIKENAVYPGIPEILTYWQKMGKKVMLCTSKPELFAREILDQLQLVSYFNFVGGATFDGSRNEKADVIAYVLETCAIKCDEAVMVGDRKYDIIGAQKNGVRSAGVLYGYGNLQELMEAGADYILENPEDLKKL